ncbi:uncharacterized protein LOC144468463 [Augochlora pura]
MNGKWSAGNNALKTRRNSSKERRKTMHRLVIKPHETEEEATTRRFHDAQRMARFRARRRKTLEEAKVLETVKFNEPSLIAELKKRNITFETNKSIVDVTNIGNVQTFLPTQKSSTIVHIACEQSRYSKLLEIIEDMGKDIKLAYAGSKTSAERLKAGITQAKILIKECLLETEMSLWHLLLFIQTKLKMEEERGSIEVPTKITEPVLSVPNPRALQQTVPTVPGQSKYIQLLNVIEELGHEVRPTYAGSRTSAEKIKRGIVHARILVRECLVETERSARQ